MDETPQSAPAVLRPTDVRWLTPDNTHLFEGTFSLLHCTVAGEASYRGVFTVPLFPISQPDHWISLRHTDLEDHVHEIGIIEDLAAFPEEARALIRTSLARQHHQQVIVRIHDIKSQFGILFFDVETQRGREQLMLPWRRDRVDDYGENGKLILDYFDNRYVLLDVDDLPLADRRLFRRFIYW